MENSQQFVCELAIFFCTVLKAQKVLPNPRGSFFFVHTSQRCSPFLQHETKEDRMCQALVTSLTSHGLKCGNTREI